MNGPTPLDFVSDEIVQAGGTWGRIIRRGEVLRIVDLHGQQAVDFLCYDAADPSDRYSATNTIKMQGNMLIGKGAVLYSDLGNPLFNVIADTCGSHDTIAGCCSEANNFLRYGVRNTPNCYANFLTILGKFGLGRNEIVANINFFMRVPVQGAGKAAIARGDSAPGSHIELRAEMDVLAVISNCPQINNPANDYNPTAIQLVITEH